MLCFVIPEVELKLCNTVTGYDHSSHELKTPSVIKTSKSNNLIRWGVWL